MSLSDAEMKSSGSRADHFLNAFSLTRGDGSGVIDLDDINTGWSMP